jgi:hypothetical protein
MIKAAAFCVVLCFTAFGAEAQLLVTTFDPQRAHVSTTDPALVAAADGKVLMRLQGLTDEDTPRSWSSVYVLDRRGNVLRRIDFPEAESTQVVPYRKGFVARHNFTGTQCHPPCGRFTPGRSELVFYDLSRAGIEPVVIDRRDGAIDVVGSLDRSDLYVIDVESEESQVSRVTRFDREYRPAWSRSFALLDWGSVTGTEDGVVLEQQYYEPRPRFVLRAIGLDGAERWNSEVPERVMDHIQFVPTGFLVIPASSRLAPYRMDAKTGRMLPDGEYQPTQFTAPTEDGLLLAGPMLGQSFAAMLEADGTFAWMRRFNQDSDLKTFKSGVMTDDGRLLLVASGDFSSKFTFVSVERDGKSLESARSACLTQASSEAAAVDRGLQQKGVFVVSPNEPVVDDSGITVPRRNGCPAVTEAEYVAFMDALSSALPAASGRRQMPQIAIRLLPSGDPWQLDTYALGNGGWFGHGIFGAFAVPHDRGADFARFLLDTLWPHERRMADLQREFAELTRFDYGASIGKSEGIPQALARLELAATALNERVKAMPPDRMAYVLETRRTDCVGAVLTPDGFGTGYDDDPFGNRPISEAAETLVHIAELRRKSIAAGDVCTNG